MARLQFSMSRESALLSASRFNPSHCDHCAKLARCSTRTSAIGSDTAKSLIRLENWMVKQWICQDCIYLSDTVLHRKQVIVAICHGVFCLVTSMTWLSSQSVANAAKSHNGSARHASSRGRHLTCTLRARVAHGMPNAGLALLMPAIALATVVPASRAGWSGSCCVARAG